MGEEQFENLIQNSQNNLIFGFMLVRFIIGTKLQVIKPGKEIKMTKNDYKKLISLEMKLQKRISEVLDADERYCERIAFKLFEKDKEEIVVICYMDNGKEIEQKKIFLTVQEMFGE